MHTNSRFTIAAFVSLLFFTPSFANLYQGTITETVTSSKSKFFQEGDVQMGWFSYESDTVDGDFGTPKSNHPEADLTLKGEIGIFTVWSGQLWDPVDLNYAGFGYQSHLIVENGLVTYFTTDGQTGPTDVDLMFTTFHVNDFGADIVGTLVFSAPQRVPDSSASTGLLVLVAGGLMVVSAWIRRRRPLLYAAATAAIAVSASANLYQGTITQTITETASNVHSIGEVAVGWYSYESDDVNGDFGTFGYTYFANHPTSVPTLHGEVNIFSVWQAGGWLSLEYATFSAQTRLVVNDGLVSDFFTEGQTGGSDVIFGVDYFWARDFSVITTGSVAFSAPERVPDGASTAVLLSFGVLAVLLSRASSRKKVWVAAVSLLVGSAYADSRLTIFETPDDKDHTVTCDD